MRSVCWKPGNIYNGAREPRYNAISYTWGRFAIRGAEQRPEVGSLEVGNIPWAVPRVNPSHFTVADFQNALETASNVPELIFEREGERPLLKLKSLEYVWIDVACIDQRRNRDSQLEIGRQAQIFGNATSVYIWLCQTGTETLQDAGWDVRHLSEEACRNIPAWFGSNTGGTVYAAEAEAGYDAMWLDNGLEALQSFCTDPWFSSLWTLQEAYLRPDACFMSRDGTILQYHQSFDFDFEPGEADPGWLFTMDELLFAAENSRSAVTAKASAKKYEEGMDNTPYTEMLRFLDVSGLNALSRENPLELYTASTSKKPSRVNDSIYGIMQVFDFRLGTSAPDADPNAQLTLTDLEDELGQELQRLCPALSQSFRHDHWPREPGRSWRISRQSSVPGLGYTDYTPWRPELYNTSCVLGTTRLDGLLWATFSGLVCPFRKMRETWSYANDEDTYENPLWDEGESDMCIVLDTRPGLHPQPETPDTHHLCRGPQQYKAARELNTTFGSRLYMLHLGSYDSEEDDMVSHTGLLLLQPDERGSDRGHWERIGVCTWQVGMTRPQHDEETSHTENAEWAQGWRPLFLEGCPELMSEETIEEVQACWDILAVRNESVWTSMQGIFG